MFLKGFDRANEPANENQERQLLRGVLVLGERREARETRGLHTYNLALLLRLITSTAGTGTMTTN